MEDHKGKPKSKHAMFKPAAIALVGVLIGVAIGYMLWDKKKS